MASARPVVVVYLCLLVVLVHEINDVEARRGGGGSRTSSRSRSVFSSSRAARARTYTSVALTGRVLGSSSYTVSTWRNAAMLNYIYGGPRYIRLYSHRQDMPPICTNNYQKSPEGRVYGYFICPRDNESYTFTYCCGPAKREYCCDMTMAQEFSSSYRKRGGLSTGGIIGIVVAITIICVIVFICCKKRKQAGVIIRTFSKRNGGGKRPDHNQVNQTVPLNGPAPAYDGFTPAMPPPSYDAVSAQQAYDGVNGLPYGPPQPPPNIDEKSGLSPPDIGDALQPYWTPYPPAYSHDTPAPSAPYPPASAPNSGDAPCPPQGDAPYPPPGGAPYPPSGDAPYPPSGGAPYPAPGGTPYPSYGPPNPDSLVGTAK